MKKSWVENIIAGSYALALHIVLIVLLIIGMGSEVTRTSPPRVDIVQATVLDEDTVMADIKRRQQIEDEKQKQELARQAELDKKEQQKRDELARIERERLQKIEQQKIEQQRQQLEKEKQQQREAERKIAQEEEQKRLEQQKRADELKQQKIAEQKKREAEEQRKLKVEQERKAAEEKKRKAELERKKKEEQKRKVEEEKKRKAELERKRKEAEAAKRAEADRLLKESLEAEAREQETNRIAGVVAQHAAIIKQRVKRNWNKPVNAERGLQCTLQVDLMPGGDVKQVRVIKSSGNAIFDRSAESAVYKAAPLPLPTDVKAAAKFRSFQFIFKPE